jgi:hypothetical protein
LRAVLPAAKRRQKNHEYRLRALRRQKTFVVFISLCNGPRDLGRLHGDTTRFSLLGKPSRIDKILSLIEPAVKQKTKKPLFIDILVFLC